MAVGEAGGERQKGIKTENFLDFPTVISATLYFKASAGDSL